MALLGKKDRADDGESAASAKNVSARLRALEDRRFSGDVQLGVKGSNAYASIYFHEGGIYAAHVGGYDPVVMDRLLTEDVLDQPRWAELAVVFGAHRSDSRIGPFVVEQDWMSVDELLNLHQEYLVASLGAILAVPRARIERETEATTDAFCSLPQDVARLMRLVQGRQQRTASAWRAMEADCEPEELILRRATQFVPSNLNRDESAALLSLVDGRRALDEIAALLALTRGEATRTASLLVLSGTLAVSHDERAQPPTDRLLVPEAWGRTLAAPPPRSVPEAGPRPTLARPADREPADREPVDREPADREFRAWSSDMIHTLRLTTVAEPDPVLPPMPPASGPPAALVDGSVDVETDDVVSVEFAADEPVDLEPAPAVEPGDDVVVAPVDFAPVDFVTDDLAPVPVDLAPADFVTDDLAPVPVDLAPADFVTDDFAPVVEPVDFEPADVQTRGFAPDPTGAEPTVVDEPADPHRRLREATDEAMRLEQLLSEAVLAEQDALARSAAIRERLREALTRVLALTGAVTGIDADPAPADDPEVTT